MPAGYIFQRVPRYAMRRRSISVGLGVVGPASYGEEAQGLVHRVKSIREPSGWGAQLRNEVTLQAFYQRTHRLWRYEPGAGFGFDVMPHYGAALGNVYVYANTGASLRFGRNLPDDFGPPRMQPGVPGSDYSQPRHRFGWYVFAGTDGRAMVRNLFLDGNTFRDSPSVRIGYTHVWRTREFRGQLTPQAFGALSIAYRF